MKKISVVAVLLLAVSTACGDETSKSGGTGATGQGGAAGTSGSGGNAASGGACNTAQKITACSAVQPCADGMYCDMGVTGLPCIPSCICGANGETVACSEDCDGICTPNGTAGMYAGCGAPPACSSGAAKTWSCACTASTSYECELTCGNGGTGGTGSSCHVGGSCSSGDQCKVDGPEPGCTTSCACNTASGTYDCATGCGP